MGDPIAEVDAVSVNADDLEAAIEQATDENGYIHGNSTVVGEAAIVGDDYLDGDLTLANVSDLNRLDEFRMDAETATFTNVRQVRDAIEDARYTDAVDHVENLVGAGVDVSETSLGGVKAVASSFVSTEMQDLTGDEAVEITHLDTYETDVKIMMEVDEEKIRE